MTYFTLTYYDERGGDTYVVEYNLWGEFLNAKRYIEPTDPNPLRYWNLADLPLRHRHGIEHEIEVRLKKKL